MDTQASRQFIFQQSPLQEREFITIWLMSIQIDDRQRERKPTVFSIRIRVQDET